MTRLQRYCIARMVHKTGPSEHSDRESESENQNNPDAWTRARFSALGPCTAARGPPRSYQNRLLGNQTIGQRPWRCVFKGQKKTCWNSGPGFLANSKAKHRKTKVMTKVTWDPFKKNLVIPVDITWQHSKPLNNRNCQTVRVKWQSLQEYNSLFKIYINRLRSI